ncbi:MAG: hypothetical protein ACO4B5_12055 [Steroidobacteraceae bacterium]
MAFRFAGENQQQLNAALEAAAQQQAKMEEGGPVNYSAGVPTRSRGEKFDIQGGYAPEFAQAANQRHPEAFYGNNGFLAKLQHFDRNAGLVDPAQDQGGYA